MTLTQFLKIIISLDPKHKKLKERFLIGRNRTKRANFRGSPLFQATYNNDKKQKNKQLIQLISCQLDVGGWRKEKEYKP